MSQHGAAFDRAERSYLEPPDGSFPPGVEDELDTIILWPETDEDADVPELGRISEYEDGGYEDGVTYTVVHLGTGEKCSMAQERVCDFAIPALQDAATPYQKALAEAVELVENAERMEERAKTERVRAANALRRAVA